eukprot:CAMPEP_0180116384 /NCGR_PEP_ID=MMETSP0986-20121125/341_1 /TAXON_ID=697907 /ORGANISM="non described non described, Strain CCMP2293" /LENGTH=129 /DNA_ID=CAMNT_0022055157 /DNA_START=21 /DNA_END=410 /DNA_ORIENTATION=+
MTIAFSCSTCEARVVRSFTKHAYTRGVVVARIDAKDGCKRADGGDHCMHLISDNLGWFEDNPVNVETMMAAKGERVQRVQLRFPEASGGDGTANGDAAAGGSKEITLVKVDEGGVVEMTEEETPGAGKA